MTHHQCPSTLFLLHDDFTEIEINSLKSTKCYMENNNFKTSQESSMGKIYIYITLYVIITTDVMNGNC